MDHGVSETWADPDGEIHAAAADGAIADGWIGFVPGPTPRLRMREGAVPRKATAAMRKALEGIPAETLVASDWGDRALGELLSHMRRCGCSSHHTAPAEELRKAIARLEKAETEVPVALWLAAGLDAGREPDDERFRAAIAGMHAAANRGGAAVGAIPSVLNPYSKVVRTPEELRGIALRTFAGIETHALEMEKAWMAIAGAAAGAEGEPGEPRPLPDSTGDVLVDLRRVQERIHEADALGLDNLWSRFPRETRMGPALAVARTRSESARRYLATGRAKIDAGEDPRWTTSFYAGHECARLFSLGRWLTEDVEKAWKALRTASAAPSGPAP